MNAREAIHKAMGTADHIVQAYLGDLSDAELLVRPVPGANHIAWQLGHLISSEHAMVNAVCPGVMPPLPAGFTEKYTRETAALDDAGAFHSKAEYLRLYSEQRAGTLAALGRMSDEDLDRPAPEQFRSFLATVGDLFNLQAIHPTMHAGQWAVTRRKLGRPPLF